MPYYLVTHTSLVEAENEVKAAEQVLMNLRSDDGVQFQVKFDEATIKAVVVASADGGEGKKPAMEDGPSPLNQMQAVLDHGGARQGVSVPPHRLRSSRKAIAAGAALFVAGFLSWPIFNLIY